MLEVAQNDRPSCPRMREEEFDAHGHEDDKMPRETAARGAVDSALECAELDEIRGLVTLPHPDDYLMDIVSASFEDLRRAVEESAKLGLAERKEMQFTLELSPEPSSTPGSWGGGAPE